MDAPLSLTQRINQFIEVFSEEYSNRTPSQQPLQLDHLQELDSLLRAKGYESLPSYPKESPLYLHQKQKGSSDYLLFKINSTGNRYFHFLGISKPLINFEEEFKKDIVYEHDSNKIEKYTCYFVAAISAPVFIAGGIIIGDWISFGYGLLFPPAIILGAHAEIKKNTGQDERERLKNALGVIAVNDKQL